MAAVLLALANKGRFCGAKPFIRNNNAANRLTASWSGIEKEENEKNVPDPEVHSEFSLRGRRVVELNVLAEALDGGCEACGAVLRLSDCIKETVWARIPTLRVLRIPSVERQISVEQIRPTVAPEQLEGDRHLM